jgi:hypothetical protein
MERRTNKGMDDSPEPSRSPHERPGPVERAGFRTERETNAPSQIWSWRAPQRSRELEGLQIEIRNKNETIKNLKQEVRRLETELEATQKDVQNHEVEIRKVQGIAFERMDEDTWITGDDRNMTSDLTKLRDRVQNWARKYAMEDMSSIINGLRPEDLESFRFCLSKVFRLRHSELQQLQSPLMNKRAPALCLAALFTDHCYTYIMQRPFFVFENQSNLLQCIYEKLLGGKYREQAYPINIVGLTLY